MPKLMEQVHRRLRELHYSYRTEQSYSDWIRRFILYHDKTHPAQMGAREVEEFLSHLAVDRKVSASTQNGYDITRFAHESTPQQASRVVRRRARSCSCTRKCWK